VAKRLGINPYFVKKVVDQARNYQVGELMLVFGRMLELDLAFKSGGRSDALFERFVMEACRG
jgi:DNA polymerase-3 subunit delta